MGRTCYAMRIMMHGLQFWDDREARTPSGHMAMDEALLLGSDRPTIRFYRWSASAVTFGYAQKYWEVRVRAGGFPMIRRWTGGGVVFHGQDLTIAVAVPHGQELCRLKARLVYRKIHEAFLHSVKESLSGARLADSGDCRPGAACFEAPTMDDILVGGRKICGGALRRGKAGLLYQGSLHGTFSAPSLARSLFSHFETFKPNEEMLRHQSRLEREKYGTEAWNQMR